MISKNLFRDSGHVIQTRAQRAWPWVLLGCMFVVGVIGFPQQLDLDSEARHQALKAQREAALQAAFDEGRRAGHADMVASAVAAWHAAQLEADRCITSRGVRQ